LTLKYEQVAEQHERQRLRPGLQKVTQDLAWNALELDRVREENHRPRHDDVDDGNRHDDAERPGERCREESRQRRVYERGGQRGETHLARVQGDPSPSAAAQRGEVDRADRADDERTGWSVFGDEHHDGCDEHHGDRRDEQGVGQTHDAVEAEHRQHREHREGPRFRRRIPPHEKNGSADDGGEGERRKWSKLPRERCHSQSILRHGRAVLER
jgi:hypothetical protein